MASLSDLRRHRKPGDVEAEVYASLASQGIDSKTWKPGAVVRTIIKGTAIVVSAADALRVAMLKGGFLALAEGDWLTLLARQLYGVERIEGAPASGLVVLTNSGGGVFAGAPGDLVFSASSGDAQGKNYRSTESYTLPSGAHSPTSTTVAVEAVEIGTASSVGAGEIDRLETALLGVACTNPAALIGVDRETDAELRRRCLEKLGSLSACGPRDAYAYAARSAVDADGQSIGVTRLRTIADGMGGIRVIVADAGGELSPPNVAIVQAAIDALATPEGITAIAESAAQKVVDVEYELWVRDSIGLTNDEIEAAVRDALEALVSSVPIGGDKVPGDSSGRLYKEAIEAAISSAVGPLYLVDLAVTAPGGDMALDIDEAPGLGTVTPPTIHRVTR